ncbi:MAG: excinuclease ABC subunit UvrC [Clostridia bacterium]|nr:excinuclease ABC subunit UvrC [Clostridia bacterium]
MNERLRLKIENLPESPGCYLMKNQGQIIYVGKARNLKNRVRQYFHESRTHTVKVRAMVDHVDDFDVILVDGELEALILENNLIKLHKPRYNILLKDDKAYPYIRVDVNEPYPRVELARRSAKDGARYFGPYMSATVVRETLDVVRQAFPVRTCKRTISPDKPTRPCVQREIGQCLGPCANLTTPEEYRRVVDQVLDFLNGNDQPVIDELTARMKQAAAGMNFERAALYRDRLKAVELLMQKQKAVHTGGGDQDVLAVCRLGDDGYVQRLVVRGGRMIGSDTHVLDNAGEDEPSDILTSFMLQFYAEECLPPREILVSDGVEDADVLSQLLSERRGGRVAVKKPDRGEKKKLTDMAQKNARDAAEKRQKQISTSYARTQGALKELADVLGLERPPRRIEGYDISNTQGVQSVGSMVVMIDGKAANKAYRHFTIKTVEGANDFASIREVITRRLKHGLQELEERNAAGEDPRGGKFSDLPDLILIDGGQGQLENAVAARDELGLRMPMFGLAKRLEEIVLPGEDRSILLDRHSPALHLIQRVRDEAHRFAISHHRSLRGAAALRSRLDDIPGVGPVRRKALLKHFETMEALESATVEGICEVEGISTHTAEAIFKALHGENDDSARTHDDDGKGEGHDLQSEDR